MVCIIGVGLLLSVRTGFLQIRKFPYTIKTTIGRMFRKKDASDGAMTPFQAVCTALAGTVGTGNIAGVAGAIAIGGPGAVFWMWCSALLGMCTKFAEVTLAVHFRERSETGEWVGGPMYYIKNGLGKRWQFLAFLYSLFGVLTVFGTGNATQVNTIVAAVDTALLEYGVVGSGFLSTLNIIVGIIVAMLVAMVLLGGIKRERKAGALHGAVLHRAGCGRSRAQPAPPALCAGVHRGRCLQPSCLHRRHHRQPVHQHAEGRLPRHLFQ